MLDDVTRRLVRTVHESKIERSFDQALGQNGGLGSDGGDGDIRCLRALAGDPLHQKPGQRLKLAPTAK